jgi:hypothetical protein
MLGDAEAEAPTIEGENIHFGHRVPPLLVQLICKYRDTVPTEVIENHKQRNKTRETKPTSVS